MTARSQSRIARAPLGRMWVLLVLGLLVGLIGMHALAPDAVASAGTGHGHTAHTTRPDHAGGGERLCHGSTGGGHTAHADAACASGAVGAGPVLPAPANVPVGVLPPGDSARSDIASVPDGERAPPSLAELQLLRI
ncbi:DUF6153 family protein [Streptomyces sp. NPDC051940]|uniref:DUF6153 family protein n=1 Tax=Streptomyces sp. NPDC051940 TaxID=3155675 RepID=UPI00341CE34E